jgi:hypothetical protein
MPNPLLEPTPQPQEGEPGGLLALLKQMPPEVQAHLLNDPRNLLRWIGSFQQQPAPPAPNMRRFDPASLAVRG